MSWGSSPNNRKADVLSSFIVYYINVLSKKGNDAARHYIESQEEFSDSFWKGLPVTKEEFIEAIPIEPIKVFSNEVYYTHDDDIFY